MGGSQKIFNLLGVSDRDVLSQLFAVEILAIKLRNDPTIKGFNVTTNKRTQCYRASQYADDSILILKNIRDITSNGDFKAIWKFIRARTES